MKIVQNKVPGKNLLLIGGNLHLINSLEQILLFAGATVHVYTTGEKALVAVQGLLPDLIILESSLKDITVSELCKKLQANEATALIPVLLIAKEESFPVLRTSFTTGRQKYIPTEDFDPSTVISLLEKMFTEDFTKHIPKLIDLTEQNKNSFGVSTKENLKLLIVEDDLFLQNLLSIRLQMSTISYSFCSTGIDALDTIIETCPDVIIMDITLPGKSGLEILAELRQIPDFATTPVIIFSNRDDQKEREIAKQLGVTSYLVKITTDLSKVVEIVIAEANKAGR